MGFGLIWFGFPTAPERGFLATGCQLDTAPKRFLATFDNASHSGTANDHQDVTMKQPNLTQSLPPEIPGSLLNQQFSVIHWTPPAPPEESLSSSRDLLLGAIPTLLVLARHPG